MQEDIRYLKDKLMLDKTDEEAAAEFKVEIQKSLNDFYRRFDNWLHDVKHG
jgi:hypothetical protein